MSQIESTLQTINQGSIPQTRFIDTNFSPLLAYQLLLHWGYNWADEKTFIQPHYIDPISVPFCHPVRNRQWISGVLNAACFANIDE